jgi:DNA-binding NarL/FixJ family response regulator
MLKIILVDDHTIFREGIKTMLTVEGIAEIIGEAGDGKKFLELLPNHQPDLVLMDISMPVMDGIEATKKALEIYPDLVILTLSSFGDEKYYAKMIEAGVKGFLIKNTNIAELEQAILEVANGGSWFSNELLRKVIASMKTTKSIQNELSDREIEILKLVCNGLTNEQIADQVNLSYDTIRWHRSNLLSKTKCTNTASLVMYAIKNKIIEI